MWRIDRFAISRRHHRSPCCNDQVIKHILIFYRTFNILEYDNVNILHFPKHFLNLLEFINTYDMSQ